MILPSLTKNEKIFIFSAFIVILLFWGGFVGYFLIKLNRIVNSETKPIDTSAYRLPTSSPTIVPTQQPKQKPTLARFTDSEYNFSFIYPSELTVKEIDNPREKLLEFARGNHSTLSAKLNIISRPTPSLETTLPIVKQYSVINPSNPETDLIDVSVVEGSYKAQALQAQELEAAYKQMEELEKDKKPKYHELAIVNDQKAIVLEFSNGIGNIYTIAYYSLGDKYYLQIEIQPEMYSNNLEISYGILKSVRLQ